MSRLASISPRTHALIDSIRLFVASCSLFREMTSKGLPRNSAIVARYILPSRTYSSESCPVDDVILHPTLLSNQVNCRASSARVYQNVVPRVSDEASIGLGSLVRYCVRHDSMFDPPAGCIKHHSQSSYPLPAAIDEGRYGLSANNDSAAIIVTSQRLVWSNDA